MRFDIFSVGALWYHMVTGRYPGGTDVTEVLRGLGDVPRADLHVIVRCMASNEKCPESVTELLDVLQGETRGIAFELDKKFTLSKDEVAVFAAFAMELYYGNWLSPTDLRKNMASIGVADQLRCGVAVNLLTKHGFVERSMSGQRSGWALTEKGQGWLAENGNLVLEVQRSNPDQPQEVDDGSW